MDYLFRDSCARWRSFWCVVPPIWLATKILTGYVCALYHVNPIVEHDRTMMEIFSTLFVFTLMSDEMTSFWLWGTKLKFRKKKVCRFRRENWRLFVKCANINYIRRSNGKIKDYQGGNKSETNISNKSTRDSALKYIARQYWFDTE